MPWLLSSWWSEVSCRSHWFGVKTLTPFCRFCADLLQDDSHLFVDLDTAAFKWIETHGLRQSKICRKGTDVPKVWTPDKCRRTYKWWKRDVIVSVWKKPMRIHKVQTFTNQKPLANQNPKSVMQREATSNLCMVATSHVQSIDLTQHYFLWSFTPDFTQHKVQQGPETLSINCRRLVSPPQKIGIFRVSCWNKRSS